ncbi:MAG: FimV/HubP family polar landmark protein [Methylacidiphilales bacterium]|nr:FimV/HubP family polar landmark protein [Candidatus Methylacidiphilales bacterium]
MRLNRLLKVVAFCAGCSCYGVVYAISFGNLTVESYYNEPLLATIPIYDHTASELNALKISIAGDGEYANAGLSKDYVLNSITFKIFTNGKGESFVQLTTVEGLKFSIADLLIQFNWSSGALIRQYPLLLDFYASSDDVVAEAIRNPEVDTFRELNPDNKGVVDISRLGVPLKKYSEKAERKVTPPPVQSEVSAAKDTVVKLPDDTVPTNDTQVASDTPSEKDTSTPANDTQVATNEQPVSTAPTVKVEEKKAEPEKPVVASAPIRLQVDEESAAEVSDVQSVSVVKGDTLSQLASRYMKSGFTLNQMMLAFYSKNPDAFLNNNINYLKSGVSLKIPNDEVVSSISKSVALAKVQSQYDEFHASLNRYAPVPTAVQKATSSVAKKQFEVLSSDSEIGGKGSVSQSGAKGGKSLIAQLDKKKAEAVEKFKRLIEKEQSLLESTDRQIVETAKLIAIEQQKLAKLEKEVALLKNEVPVTPKIAEAPIVQTPPPLKVEEDKGLFVELKEAFSAALSGDFSKLFQSKSVLIAIVVALIAIIIFFNLIRYIINLVNVKKNDFQSKVLDSGHHEISSQNESQVESLFSKISNYFKSLLPGSGGASIEVSDGFGGVRKIRPQHNTMQHATSVVAPLGAGIAQSEDSLESVQSSPSHVAHASKPLKETVENQEFLEEINTYLGYGLYEQAEIVLNEAIQNDEGNKSFYYTKLLELFYTTKNVNKFKEFANLAKNSGDELLWDKAVSLGKNLIPNDPLFAHESSSAILKVSDLMVERRKDTDVDLSDAGKVVDILETDLDVGGSDIGKISSSATNENDLLDIVGDLSDQPEDLIPSSPQEPSASQEHANKLEASFENVPFEDFEMKPVATVHAEDEAMLDFPNISPEETSQNLTELSNSAVKSLENSSNQSLSENIDVQEEIKLTASSPPAASNQSVEEMIEKTQAFDGNFNNLFDEEMLNDSPSSAPPSKYESSEEHDLTQINVSKKLQDDSKVTFDSQQLSLSDNDNEVVSTAAEDMESEPEVSEVADADSDELLKEFENQMAQLDLEGNNKT